MAWWAINFAKNRWPRAEWINGPSRSSGRKSAWCRFGVQDSTGFAIRIENRYKGLRGPHKLKSACCQNQCPHKGDMVLGRGLIGDEKGEPKVARPISLSGRNNIDTGITKSSFKADFTLIRDTLYSIGRDGSLAPYSRTDSTRNCGAHWLLFPRPADWELP
jgi:hypothetical protein